jgi:hypothetical protein
MSIPSTIIVPSGGSISRLMQRTSVDLPLPERPITTKISFGCTSNETSLTAATWPVCSRTSCFEAPFFTKSITLFGSGPKIFQTFRQDIPVASADIVLLL